MNATRRGCALALAMTVGLALAGAAFLAEALIALVDADDPL